MNPSSKLKPNLHENPSRKLKPDRNALIRFLVSLFLCVAILGLIITFTDPQSWAPGLHTLDYAFLGLYLLLGIWQLIPYWKTRNPAHLGMGIMLLLFIPYLLVGTSPYSEFRLLFYPAWLAIFFIWGPVRRRNNPHFRQVLELAARPVEETAAGFTSRPYPSGSAAYTREELDSFARFLMRRWIATAYPDAERVVLVIGGFSWKHFIRGKIDFQRLTYVAFDNEGKVSVNISRKDYQKYRDQLSFEQLCASLGSLMTRFLAYHQTGNAENILAVIDEEMSRSHWFFRETPVPATGASANGDRS